MTRSPLVVVALSLWVLKSHAHPQYSVGVVPGVGHQRGDVAFDGSLVGTATFGQNDPSDLGFGPRAEIGTFGFESLRFNVGPAIHLPWEPLALVFSAHIGASRYERALSLGIGARALLGFRPYNYYGSYAAAAGLTLGVDHWLSARPSFVVGAQLDAMWLSLPLLALVEIIID